MKFIAHRIQLEDGIFQGNNNLFFVISHGN